MACAVAMPSHVPMKFKGDATELVDRLVEASNYVKPTAGKIVERELQPFSFEDSPLPAAKSSNRSPRGSPRCSPPKAHKFPKSASSSGPSRRSLDPGSQNSKPAPSLFASIGSADDLVRVLTGNATSFPDADFLASAKACPGFFTSPRPCEIPMPTSTLLVKATVVKA